MTTFKKAQIRAQALENCWDSLQWYIDAAQERIQRYTELDKDVPDSEKQYTSELEEAQITITIYNDVRKSLEKML